MKIEKILLVDDDHNIQVIVRMGLENRPDWQLLLASSGAEALEIAAIEKPDLVLLDIMMPGMDGKTTFIKLRQMPDLADMPVIFITAKVLRNEFEDYLKLGVSGVITKPFDPMTLSQEIIRIGCSG